LEILFGLGLISKEVKNFLDTGFNYDGSSFNSAIEDLNKRQDEDDAHDTKNDKSDELRSDAMFAGVVCTDESLPVSTDERKNSEQDFLDSSRLYGPYSFKYSSDMCVNWPVKRDPIVIIPDLETELIYDGVHVLILGGEYDTATPYKGVLKMKGKFGKAATLLTVDNYVTHDFSYTFYIKWLDNLTTGYLIDPALPIANKHGNKKFYAGVTPDSDLMATRSINKEREVHPARKVRMGPHSNF